MLLLNRGIIILFSIISLLFQFTKKRIYRKRKNVHLKTEDVIIRFKIRKYLNSHDGTDNSRNTTYHLIYKYFVNEQI